MDHGSLDHRSNGSVYVTWRDYASYQDAVRESHRREREAFDERLREVEGVIDQQRGARTLILFLIGSNLAVLAGLVLTVTSLASSR